MMPQICGAMRMLQPIKRALARRNAVRVEAAELVRMHGCEAIEMALDQSFPEGISPIERRFWRDVAIRAERWRKHLASLDTATRYLEVDRYTRDI